MKLIVAIASKINEHGKQNGIVKKYKQLGIMDNDATPTKISDSIDN